MSVGRQVVSDDGHLLAYSVDNTGYRQYQLRVKDLRTGTDVQQAVGQVSSFTWSADNDTLFYVQEDPVSKRSFHLGRWTLSTGKQAWLYDERDELFSIGVSRSLDGSFVFALPRARPRVKSGPC